MNSTPLLLVPIASLGILAAGPAPQGETREELRAYLAELDAGMAEAAEPGAQPAAGVTDSGGLDSSRLQPASGLHSAARGLTPDSEWQQIFPRYAKRD